MLSHASEPSSQAGDRRGCNASNNDSPKRASSCPGPTSSPRTSSYERPAFAVATRSAAIRHSDRVPTDPQRSWGKVRIAAGATWCVPEILPGATAAEALGAAATPPG